VGVKQLVPTPFVIFLRLEFSSMKEETINSVHWKIDFKIANRQCSFLILTYLISQVMVKVLKFNIYYKYGKI
jgi:hypothetical protein